MSDYGKRMIPFILKTIDATTFDGTLLPVGSPTTKLLRMIRFINNTDQDVTISWDGVDVAGHDFFPSLTSLTLDVTANKTDTQGYFVAVGTQFFVSATVGTGIFYIASYGSET
ncbi:MAG TPA: hypothetical protein ENI23_15090 [bacterium]|nr:hypothetical protein [bacterium]